MALNAQQITLANTLYAQGHGHDIIGLVLLLAGYTNKTPANVTTELTAITADVKGLLAGRGAVPAVAWTLGPSSP